MTQSRVIQIQEPGGDFTLAHREVPSAGRGQVVVRVQACGVCHSDSFAKFGGYPGSSYPVVPGHEIAGVVHAVGEGVVGWETGDRVGVGWFGGNCGHCDPCRRGDLIRCRNMPIPGVTSDGGYADHVLVDAHALAAIPAELSAVEAAPLMCAGVTTFNALRHSGAGPGDLVAVLGLGGLGHLGVQFAARAGFRTVGIARGRDKEALARKLGAVAYVDSTADDPAQALQGLGGASAILSTVTNSGAMSAVVGGLAPRGRLMLLGASMDPVEVPPAVMIGNGGSVQGHASGTSKDSEDTLAFSAHVGVRAMVETVPLERAAEAYEKMMAGDARFRMVLTMDDKG
jgi:D-arabinose 1-dehydrogenase-like Zn-dependent alcohol dehydrogenase